MLLDFFIFFRMLNLVVSKVATGLYKVIICYHSFCDSVRYVFTTVCPSRDMIRESLRTKLCSTKIYGIIFCKSKRRFINAAKAVRPVISEPTRHFIIRPGNVTVTLPHAVCTRFAVSGALLVEV